MLLEPETVARMATLQSSLQLAVFERVDSKEKFDGGTCLNVTGGFKVRNKQCRLFFSSTPSVFFYTEVAQELLFRTLAAKNT